MQFLATCRIALAPTPLRSQSGDEHVEGVCTTVREKGKTQAFETQCAAIRGSAVYTQKLDVPRALRLGSHLKRSPSIHDTQSSTVDGAEICMTYTRQTQSLNHNKAFPRKNPRRDVPFPNIQSQNCTPSIFFTACDDAVAIYSANNACLLCCWEACIHRLRHSRWRRL